MTIKTLPNGNTEGFNTYTTSMVPEQPYPLRLADLLEQRGYASLTMTTRLVDGEVATELRRLDASQRSAWNHAVVLQERIDALEQALGMAVEALEPLIHRAAPWGEQDWLDGKAAIATARQTLGGAA